MDISQWRCSVFCVRRLNFAVITRVVPNCDLVSLIPLVIYCNSVWEEIYNCHIPFFKKSNHKIHKKMVYDKRRYTIFWMYFVIKLKNGIWHNICMLLQWKISTFNRVPYFNFSFILNFDHTHVVVGSYKGGAYTFGASSFHFLVEVGVFYLMCKFLKL